MFFFINFFFFLLSNFSCKNLIIDKKIETAYNSNRSCPSDYTLARLNTIELWREGLALALNVLGYDKRVWVRQALNMTGNGYQQWMVATPTNPNTCKFPPENLRSFCIPNKKGKLAINNQPNRKLPNLCMKILSQSKK